MIAYASRTGTRKNLEVLRAAHWRIMLAPGERRDPPANFRFAIDNGAWTAYQQQLPFEWAKFSALVERHGATADFIVIPDVVAKPAASLELSIAWIHRLRHFRLILFAVQDGMQADQVGALLERTANMGIFLGGSTEWKLRTMYAWGMVAHAFRRHYHVARVNTVRRVRLAQEAGAHSFDGSSVSRFSVNLPKLENARRQPHLYTPARIANDSGKEGLP